MIDKKTQGKKNRAAGQRFEIKVRKDLESKGWIVDKWGNNVELINKDGCGKEFIFNDDDATCGDDFEYMGEVNVILCSDCKRKLVKVKNKWAGTGRPMMLGAGFPDFIAFKKDNIYHRLYEIIGVEVKSNGYLYTEEKAKCQWLLDNNVFFKILIAQKGKKRGKIEYKYFHKLNIGGIKMTEDETETPDTTEPETPDTPSE